MKRILVAGASGFVGSNLCKKLLKQGHEVIGLDNFSTSDGQNIADLVTNKNFTFYRYDIVAPLDYIIGGVKIHQIYNLACPTGVPNLITMAEEMLLTCSLGTRNLMELALKNNAQVLFTSSSEIYGDPLVFPQSENYTGNVDPIGIRSPYEEGKRFSESLIKMYVRKYGLAAKMVRLFNVYGPGMSQSDSRIVPTFIKLAQKGKPLTVQGDGSQTRTYCYVDDLVKGLQLVMEKGATGEVYNLGGDEELTVLDLAKKVISITGSKGGIKFINRPSHDHNRRMPTLEKVRNLGWQNRVTLAQGLKKMIKKTYSLSNLVSEDLRATEKQV
jgi:UDP-glucuronate decarboxylase